MSFIRKNRGNEKSSSQKQNTKEKQCLKYKQRNSLYKVGKAMARKIGEKGDNYIKGVNGEQFKELQ